MFDWKSRAFAGYKPVRENFLTKIVDVHWPGDALNYIVVPLGIRRRFVSMAGHIANSLWPGGTDELNAYADTLVQPAPGFEDPDVIVYSILLYNPFIEWPWQSVGGTGNIIYPTVVSEDPDEFVLNFYLAGEGEGTLTGTPPLPSNVASGAPCTFRAGEAFTSVQQGTGFTPGIRGVPVGGGGFTPRYPDDVPDPPSLGPRTNDWGSPSATIEWFRVRFPTETVNVDGTESGPTIDSFTLNFGSMVYEIFGQPEEPEEGEEPEESDPSSRPGTTYVCAAVAVVPKEDTSNQHNPPFSDSPGVTANSNSTVTIMLLLERTPEDELPGAEDEEDEEE